MVAVHAGSEAAYHFGAQVVLKFTISILDAIRYLFGNVQPSWCVIYYEWF